MLYLVLDIFRKKDFYLSMGKRFVYENLLLTMICFSGADGVHRVSFFFKIMFWNKYSYWIYLELSTRKKIKIKERRNNPSLSHPHLKEGTILLQQNQHPLSHPSLQKVSFKTFLFLILPRDLALETRPGAHASRLNISRLRFRSRVERYRVPRIVLPPAQ